MVPAIRGVTNHAGSRVRETWRDFGKPLFPSGSPLEAAHPAHWSTPLPRGRARCPSRLRGTAALSVRVRRRRCGTTPPEGGPPTFKEGLVRNRALSGNTGTWDGIITQVDTPCVSPDASGPSAGYWSS